MKITRRAALGGMAAMSATGGVGAALAASPATMSTEDVHDRMEELAGEIAGLLPQHPIQRLGTCGWALTIYPRDKFWYGYQQMPGNNWREPRVEAIDAYQRGMEAYEAHPIIRVVHATEEENTAAIKATFGPSLEALKAWDRPAITRRGAIAALQYAISEGVGDDVDAMLKATLGYLESGAST